MSINLITNKHLNVTPKDIFKKINLDDQKVDLNVDIPDSFYQTLLEQFFEREYLNYTDDKVFYYDKMKGKPIVHWVQIERLPVHPEENTRYDILTRWQTALASLHAWGYRLIFLLQRKDGETRIFLGTISNDPKVTPEKAISQIKAATFGAMPGIGLRTLSVEESQQMVRFPLQELDVVGGVTGIPSIRANSDKEMLQTLDQLAFGIQGSQGEDSDYTIMVVADPIPDEEISNIIARYRTLGSQIHTAVSTSTTESANVSESQQANATASGVVSMLGSIFGAIIGSQIPFGKSSNAALIGMNLGTSLAGSLCGILGISKSQTGGGTTSVSKDFLDKFAKYAEEMTENHVERLNKGRNFGFWNTGVYVLGKQTTDIATVCGMLRSIYSGEETYLEPIRLHIFNQKSNAKKILTQYFELLPLADPNIATSMSGFNPDERYWHILGEYYQYLSTPLNTLELGLATSLPRRDVPGLRFVKTAVRFANNPPLVDVKDKLTIGHLVDMGIEQSAEYNIDPNSLVRHMLVAGKTGTGKSTTCLNILNNILSKDVPLMVIEPAKDDYVRWALKMNENLPPEKQFKIFMPGVKKFEGVDTFELKINGFEPACAKGATADLMEHCETFITLLNACLPSEEIVPILIEEVAMETLTNYAKFSGIDLDDGEVEPMTSYPSIDDMISNVKIVMDRKSYAGQNRDNLTEVLNTRFRSLSRGKRGKVMNVNKSVDFDELFSSNVIINLSRVPGTSNKAVIMSLLMNALYEYRVSRFANDAEYRAKAQSNKLLHLCLIEEAHNVLAKPRTGSGSPQSAAADLFGNMLSEVRGYGQGFVLVDQSPEKLIDDAVKNTNYKIVHRLTSPEDQTTMATVMGFREDQRLMIPSLEKGNVIICGDEDDAAVWVKIPAPKK